MIFYFTSTKLFFLFFNLSFSEKKNKRKKVEFFKYLRKEKKVFFAPKKLILSSLFFVSLFPLINFFKKRN